MTPRAIGPTEDLDSFRRELLEGIPVQLPPPRELDPALDHAPPQTPRLSRAERALAVANALRYLPREWHRELAAEFAHELARHGQIFMHRLRPQHAIYARPIDHYPARSRHAAALMLMIQNNLDPQVAQFPEELITYGGNGAVFGNWAQYRLTMKYLAQMSDEQTLVMYSGHPLGLFPSHPDAPRVVVTNGMMVPEYSTLDDYARGRAQGVTLYGQMTAGSYMYIGPQGIVHGTTITLLGAARRYLKLHDDQGLQGRVFVTSGLGGMSGAQAKAATIAGAIGVIAEINPAPLKRRLDQGWLMEAESDLDKLLIRIDRAVRSRQPLSLGYLGNIVDLWERLVEAGLAIDLGSDQTSLHNPFQGGYYPAGISLEAARIMMKRDPAGFREAVDASLRRQVIAINTLSARGLFFWDYGNAFLVEAQRAGADVSLPGGEFRYPSYVEDIMGPLCFDYGFGPFRWVCCSGDPRDLATTDAIAADVIATQAAVAPPQIKQQMLDNLRWIEEAGSNQMVVGSQARILYADRQGRRLLAAAFNLAIARGEVHGPIVLGRDHHDVSGTDSPWRETANIRDGSRFTADMAVQNVIGDSFRGATWVSLHNGGGVGWGKVINGGFGLLLDGTNEAAARAHSMLGWDVANGVARRAWARNPGALFAIQEAMKSDPSLEVTLPQPADASLIAAALDEAGYSDDSTA
ncbi:MAG: urocanate hydratase [Acidobacteriota bacterium]